MKTMKTIFALLNVALFALAASSATAADDRGWKAPVLVESSDAGDANSQQIAFDAQGNALAVWQQPDETRSRIWVSRYTGRGVWGAAEPIDSAPGNTAVPQVAMDASGNGLAIWVQSDGTFDRIAWSRYTVSDHRWVTGATRIDANTGHASPPQIAIDANGNALALWVQRDGTRNRIRWSRYTASDNHWVLGTTRIDTDIGSASAPQLAFDASGNALAVWQQLVEGLRNNVWASRYVGGTWEAAVPLETGAGTAITPQVAFDRSGNALAAWVQFDSGRNRIFTNRRTTGATGIWLGAEAIDTNAGEASSPKLAVDTNGNALTVWYQSVLDQSGVLRRNIWSNRYVASNVHWDGAVLLEHDDAGDAISPSIAFDANGNALAVWYQQQSDAATLGIWAARYTPGTPGSGWDAAELIERDDRGNAIQPRVAFDTNGTAVAVWRQSDGEHFNITASWYAVRQWGAPTMIETDAADRIVVAQVAIDARGNALAVWEHVLGGLTNILSSGYTIGQGWNTAATLTRVAGSVRTPRVAMNASGNALAVWAQTNGTNFDIWSNRYTGGTWDIARQVETDNTGSALDPQVAIDASGNALAVWSQFDGTRYSFRSNRSTPNGHWDIPRLIETDHSGNRQSSAESQVAFDARGNALVVWSQDGRRIWSNRYTAGRDWSTAWDTALLIETVDLSSRPRLAIDASGNARAIWYRFDANIVSDTLWSNHYTASSDWRAAWGTAVPIETSNAAFASPEITVDASGNALAVWAGADDRFNFNLWSRRYTTGGDWGPLTLVDTDDTGNVSGATIAVDGSGNTLAVWTQRDPDDGFRHIWSNRYVNGGDWDTPVQIDANRSEAGGAEIAVNESGDAVAVWIQGDKLWSSRFE